MNADIDSLRAEIERLRAGEDLTPRDEACQATPGQAWHELLGMTEEQRIERLGHLLDAVGRVVSLEMYVAYLEDR